MKMPLNVLVHIEFMWRFGQYMMCNTSCMERRKVV